MYATVPIARPGPVSWFGESTVGIADTISGSDPGHAYTDLIHHTDNLMAEDELLFSGRQVTFRYVEIGATYPTHGDLNANLVDQGSPR